MERIKALHKEEVESNILQDDGSLVIDNDRSSMYIIVNNYENMDSGVIYNLEYLL